MVFHLIIFGFWLKPAEIIFDPDSVIQHTGCLINKPSISLSMSLLKMVKKTTLRIESCAMPSGNSQVANSLVCCHPFTVSCLQRIF